LSKPETCELQQTLFKERAAKAAVPFAGVSSNPTRVEDVSSVAKSQPEIQSEKEPSET